MFLKKRHVNKTAFPFQQVTKKKKKKKCKWNCISIPASQYVEAFVSDSQENEGDAKEVKQEEDNAQNQDESVQIDGEQIQEFGDDVTR